MAPVTASINLNGVWASGGLPGPVMVVIGNSLIIDMSAYHRPTATGSVLDALNITVTFPEDKTYTGKLTAPGTITWSNNSAWTHFTLIDLRGVWASGGVPGPRIGVAGTALSVDMSASHRPLAHGTVVNASTITVTFPDDKAYTGTLQAPNTILWSNNSAWTKVAVTTIVVNSSFQSVITALAPQTPHEVTVWANATQNQLDVIANDYRGADEIGSAAFERASNNIIIPDSFNFWYPQTRPSDNGRHYKRTLVGKIIEAHTADISGTFQDYDLNIDITPDPPFQDLLTNAHSREYTDIMKAEWELTLHQHGQASCDDADSLAEVKFIEAEVQPSSSTAFSLLNDRLKARVGYQVGVYGAWIYDKGHCCHAEIHPAEQIWFCDNRTNGKTYTFCVICDASKRFWWRDQMDDGTKLRPWGAPPTRGLFAIAFEAHLSNVTVSQPVIFDIKNIDDYNVVEYPNTNVLYSLVYQGHTLVQFTPHNDAFKVSFELVGSAGASPTGETIRGFLVIETAVGTLTQRAHDKVPLGANVDTIPQEYEREAFEKVEGHYIFNVIRTDFSTPVIAHQ